MGLFVITWENYSRSYAIMSKGSLIRFISEQEMMPLRSTSHNNPLIKVHGARWSSHWNHETSPSSHCFGVCRSDFVCLFVFWSEIGWMWMWALLTLVCVHAFQKRFPCRRTTCVSLIPDPGRWNWTVAAAAELWLTAGGLSRLFRAHTRKSNTF